MSILLYALFALCSVLSAVVLWFFVDYLRRGRDCIDAGASEGDMQNFVIDLNRKDVA